MNQSQQSADHRIAFRRGQMQANVAEESGGGSERLRLRAIGRKWGEMMVQFMSSLASVTIQSPASPHMAPPFEDVHSCVVVRRPPPSPRHENAGVRSTGVSSGGWSSGWLSMRALSGLIGPTAGVLG